MSSSRVKTGSRTKPSEERRADLMDAALRLFMEHGVAPTTIEQITAGASVAKGTEAHRSRSSLARRWSILLL